MEIKNLWNFPVTATSIMNVHFIHKNADVLILFDYYDENNNDVVSNGSIEFKTVVAYRNTDEKFTKSLNGAYATLVEYSHSEWLNELIRHCPEWAKTWGIRHFAIYFDSYGLYEIIASDYKILESKEGPLQD